MGTMQLVLALITGKFYAKTMANFFFKSTNIIYTGCFKKSLSFEMYNVSEKLTGFCNLIT